MATAASNPGTAGQLAPHPEKVRVRDERSDGADAERWLDEGGSSRTGPGEEVTRATQMAPADQPSSPQPGHRTYSCPECGHVLRVSGLGRHCVYFELDDDQLRDPVMNRACSECGHGLPGKRPTESRS